MDVDNNDIDLIACKFRTMNTNDKDYLISEFKRLSNTQLGTDGCCFYLDLAEWNLNSALWAYYEYETAAAANNNTNTIASTNQEQTANNSPPNQQSNIGAYNNHQHHHRNHNRHYNNHHYMRADEIPEMQFVCDITIGEGESVAPNTNFVKTWRIKNSGTSRWPSGCTLKYVNGYNFSSSSSSSSSSLHSSPSSSSSSSSTDILNTNNQVPVQTTPIEIDLPELDAHETVDISISLRSPTQCAIYQCQYRTYTRFGHPFGDPIWLLLNVEEGGVLGITQQLNSFNAFGANLTSPNSGATNNLRHFIPIDTSEFNKLELDSNNNNPARFVRTASTGGPQSNVVNEEKRPDFYDDMFR